MEINPVSSLPILEKTNNSSFIRGYTPCGPYMENTQADHYWQVVWAGYWGSIDPAQQLFEIQTNSYLGNFVNKSNGPFDVQILEGAEYFSFQECIPEDYGCRWTDMGYTNLTDISGSELIGSGDLMFFDCVPRYVDQTFHIRYHYLDQDTATVVYSIHSVRLNQTKYFHTLIVKRPFILSEMNETVKIPHAEKQYFTPRPEPVFCSEIDSSSYYENYNCKGIVFSAGGSFPDNITFNVSIVEGEEYGTMLYFDSYNNKIEGNSFSNIDEYTYELIYFYANGIEPKDTGKVKIHISTTDPGIPETDVNIKVVPNQNYSIRVTFIPAVLAPGDTADIHLEKRYSEYPFSDPENVIYEPFPANQLFSVKIEKGKQFGSIFNPVSSDTSDEFVEIEQGFKFIAVDSINTDTAKISIRISTIIDNGGIIAGSIKGTDFSDPQITKSIKELNGKKSSSSIKSNWKEEERKNSKLNKDITNTIIPNSISPPSSGGAEIFGVGHAAIIQDEIEILLGETKYFAVKRKTETGELKIEEIPTDYGEEPKFPVDADGWAWQKTDIWGNTPIEQLGTKSGVYWEKRWFRSSDNTDVVFSDSGMIRLIGRFWEKGKEDSFKVKLKTINNDSIEIKVVKPNKLGTKYSKAKDVFNKDLNIDSLCIYWGGLKGIPPQLLKGHIRHESPLDPGYFAPAYRYEPFTTQFNADIKRILKTNINPFIVDSMLMGKSGAASVPTETEHQNVLYYHYPQSPKTVWEFIDEHSQFTDPNNKSFYGYRYQGTPPDEFKKGQMHSNWYSIINDSNEVQVTIAENLIREKYNLDSNSDQNKKLTLEQHIEANDSARVALVRIFKKMYNGTIAQTRIASSYGLLQILYTTALSEGFKDTLSNNPEKLNEPEGFKYNIYHYVTLFKDNKIVEESNNFVSSCKYYRTNNDGRRTLIFEAKPGYERAFENILFRWNSSSGYREEVYSNMKNFLPRR